MCILVLCGFCDVIQESKKASNKAKSSYYWTEQLQKAFSIGST